MRFKIKRFWLWSTRNIDFLNLAKVHRKSNKLLQPLQRFRFGAEVPLAGYSRKQVGIEASDAPQ